MATSPAADVRGQSLPPGRVGGQSAAADNSLARRDEERDAGLSMPVPCVIPSRRYARYKQFPGQLIRQAACSPVLFMGYAVGKSFEQIMRAAGSAVGKTMRNITPAEPPIVLQLDDIELGAIDVWIADQPEPRPSRPEAAKHLLMGALIRR